MKNFVKSVECYCKGIELISPGPCPGCYECGLEDVDSMETEEYEIASEGSFSWTQCDTCGSTLGGDRYYAHGFPEGSKDYLHLDICVDCFMFFANGDEPEEWRQYP